MSRPEIQLREYFDAGVERITAEDVIAQSKVSEDGVRSLHRQRSFKPAWAAVGAFAVTLVGLGGLASVLKLTTDITADAGAGDGEIVDAGGGTLAVWLIAAIVAAVVAGLTVWLVHRSSKPTENEEEIESDQGKVTVMETIERTETDATQKTEQRSRWPIVVIVVLSIALVGLIAWMTLAMRPNSPTAAPPEIQQLMEDYVAAFNDYDADALEALVTDNYQMQGNLADGSLSWANDMESLRSSFLPMLQGWDWRNHYEGPYYAVGSDSTMFVSSEGGRMTATGSYDYPDGDKDSVSLFRIVKVGDEWKIADHFTAFQN